MIDIRTADFDPGEAARALEADAPRVGAICSFTGLAREYGDRDDVQSLFLEHYPGMTESAIQAIVEEAAQRWSLLRPHIIHRVGRIEPGERIVFVGISSSHRRDAFEACQFIMDYLKTRAPFWKKEITPEGSHWVEQKDSDQAAAERWQSGETDQDSRA